MYETVLYKGLGGGGNRTKGGSARAIILLSSSRSMRVCYWSLGSARPVALNYLEFIFKIIFHFLGAHFYQHLP